MLHSKSLKSTTKIIVNSFLESIEKVSDEIIVCNENIVVFVSNVIFEIPVRNLCVRLEQPEHL